MTEKQSAVARVTVTLEIDAASSWGDDCTIAQVYKQAADDAVGRVRSLFNERDAMRIVGDVKVNAIREDLSYSEGIDLTNDVKRELRSIIEAAFDHPEARTIKVRK